MTPRLVVTGTRHGRPDTWEVLNAWVDMFGPPRELVYGCYVGVDCQAREWHADRWRAGVRFPIKPFPANWTRYGKSAGPRRNIEMVQYAEPGDHLIALPVPNWGKSDGTYHCHAAGLMRGLVCALITYTDRQWRADVFEALRREHAQHPRWAA